MTHDLMGAAGHSPEGSNLLAEGPIARISPADVNSDRRRRDSAVEPLTLARQAVNNRGGGVQPSPLSRVHTPSPPPSAICICSIVHAVGSSVDLTVCICSVACLTCLVL